MLEAGKTGGFSESNAAYITALQRIDAYMGEFLQAIDERENAFYEDWLVVVTSNHGGKADGSYGGNSPEERNTFGIFYYPHYTEQEMVGKKITGAYFDSSKAQGIVLDTVSSDIKYGLKEASSLSVEIVMRMNPKKDGSYSGDNWNAIFSKSDNWGIFRKGSEARLRIEGSTGALEEPITAFNDPQWHNYGFSVTPNTNYLRNWTIAWDGMIMKKGTKDIRGVEDNKSPLRICDHVPTSFYVSEIRLWKKTLAEYELTQQATLLDMSSDDPRFNDLLAYWKLNPDEVIDAKCKTDTLVIKNQIAGGLDLLYVNLDKQNKDCEPSKLKERAFVELPNTLPAYVSTGDLIMENTLVVPQVLYWLNMSANTILDGFKFINNYASSEEWRDLPEDE